MAKPYVDIKPAVAMLGIQHNVYVNFVPHKALQLTPKARQTTYFTQIGAVSGDHGFYKTYVLRRPYHWIRLSRTLADVTTLAHELIHAQQAERLKDPDAWKAYYQSFRQTSCYWSDPIEVEARERTPEVIPLIAWRGES